MNGFLVGLQFFTRITVSKNVEWSERACGESVKFFPVVGAVLGLFYLAAGYVVYFFLPEHGFVLSANMTGFILLALNIFLTGALHCDGFVDTMDGILSGRTRERILEIMKDSRVGAHGATSLILLLIGKFAAFSALSGAAALTALFLMPVIARFCMSAAVVKFSYARPEGLGKAFHEHSGNKDLIFSAVFTFAVCAFFGAAACLVLAATAAAMFAFDRYAADLLGGLTGDVYGATAELGEFAALFFFVITGMIIDFISESGGGFLF